MLVPFFSHELLTSKIVLRQKCCLCGVSIHLKAWIAHDGTVRYNDLITISIGVQEEQAMTVEILGPQKNIARIATDDALAKAGTGLDTATHSGCEGILI